MLRNEPLNTVAAKQLIRRIIELGDVAWSRHALDEIAKDKLTTVDAVNVLRGGTVLPPDYENREWRYRVQTSQMTVVVAFRSENELRVVTAWRIKR